MFIISVAWKICQVAKLILAVRLRNLGDGTKLPLPHFTHPNNRLAEVRRACVCVREPGDRIMRRGNAARDGCSVIQRCGTRASGSGIKTIFACHQHILREAPLVCRCGNVFTQAASAAGAAGPELRSCGENILNRIHIPSRGPDDWKPLLAKPDLHWKKGRSAHALANCWEAADGLPHEISRLFAPHFRLTELLLAVPEYKVPLPGGTTESQNDLFCLIRADDSTLAVMIEGKVEEPFGPTVGEWSSAASAGKEERLGYITRLLGLPGSVPSSIRYQLLHRAASAVITASRFKTDGAAMIVHSFSRTKTWLQDFQNFISLWGLSTGHDELARLPLPGGSNLLVGWATGTPNSLTPE